MTGRPQSKSTLRAVAAMACCSAVMACAHQPELSQSGRINPGSFAFAPPAPEAGAGDRQALETLVGQKLIRAGLKAAPMETADYLVDVGASLPPRGVGVYEAAPGATPPPVEAWAVKPQRRDLVQVSLVVTERATGRKIYQASATQRAKARKTAVIEAALVEALPAALEPKQP